MDESKLHLILDYDMDELQAKAFKVALLWEHFAPKEFPNYKISKLPKKGDPRKNNLLFKYRYKMVRDYKGLIEDGDLKLYVVAQLQILKAFENALVTPNCLASANSWKRWEIWKKKYDKINKQEIPQEVDEQPIALPAKIKYELDNTKEFLLSKYEHIPTLEDLERNMSDGTLFRWVFLNKVSPYYIMLSEELQQAVKNKNKDITSYFKIDFGVYKNNITEDVKRYYKEIYGHI